MFRNKGEEGRIMIYAILGYGMMAYNLYAGLHGGGWINYVFALVFLILGIQYTISYFKKKNKSKDKE